MRKVAVLVALVVALPVVAQEGPKPGPEHKLLKEREGTWETTMKAGGMEFKGVVKQKMGLGGLWLTGTMESDLFGQKFSGRSLETYDAAKKKYISIWVDSMSTSPVFLEGTYDAEKKVTVLEGEGPGMDGKPAKYREVLKTPDADTMEMTMYMGGASDPAFTVVYKRKK